MKIITDTKALKKLCSTLAKGDYVCIDTEFLREKTYYPILCLIQVANDHDEAIIDPMADGIDLAPLFKLLKNEKVEKVMHGGRQDVEIFYNLDKTIPTPLFDTQIAGMVCGFGDQIGYENLIKRLLEQQIDKGSRYTDWSRRPLSEKQLSYAMADVTYLRDAYKKLKQTVADRGREHWVKEEMAILTAPATYKNPPNKAWERVKINTRKPKVLSVVKELAAWREKTAQSCDEPRNRVMRDRAITEIALNPPKDEKGLRAIRDIHPSFFDHDRPTQVMNVVNDALSIDRADCPTREKIKPLPPYIGPISEMLKVLLKLKCEKHDVAPKLLASSSDIDHIAAYGKKAEVRALKGWRFEVFGEDALKLMRGELGFVLKKKRIEMVPIKSSKK